MPGQHSLIAPSRRCVRRAAANCSARRAPTNCDTAAGMNTTKQSICQSPERHTVDDLQLFLSMQPDVPPRYTVLSAYTRRFGCIMYLNTTRAPLPAPQHTGLLATATIDGNDGLHKTGCKPAITFCRCPARYPRPLNETNGLDDENTVGLAFTSGPPS